MKNLRILQVSDSFYPKVDGPNMVVACYTKHLNEMENVHCEVFVPATKNFKDDQPFSVHRIKSMPSKEGYGMAMPKLDGSVKRFLKQNQIDLIHIHSPFPLGRYMALMGKKFHIPTIFTFHTAFKEDFERLLKYKWQQNFMMHYILKSINCVDYVTSVSNGAGDVLRSYGYKGNIDIIRNGTDMKYPENAEELISKVNEKYNLTNEKFVCLSVGRVVENKRLDVAIEALKIVKDAGYNFKYVIVGDGNHRSKLTELVKKLELEDCVLFTGKVDNDDLTAMYLRADLFLFPSTFDTASLAPIEASAMKLPTLLTKNCPTAEIINANVNGFAEERKPDVWAKKIMEIMDNPEMLAQVGKKCVEQVYKTWKQVVDEVYEYYLNIIKNYKEKNGIKNN